MTPGTTPTRPTAEPPAGALARCVGDPAVFLEQCWTRRPVHRRGGGPDGYSDLLSLADADHILTTTAPRPPSFRLVKDGAPLAASSYTRSVRMGGEDVGAVADPGRVVDEFRAGATIVLQGLQRTWLPLARFCRELELALTHPVQANAYLTPPAARGLAVHHDGHDVFVLQVHGRKQWQVYDRGDRDTVAVDVEVRPGDCLYIPERFPHAAATNEGTSLHLTIGINTYTWRDALDAAVADWPAEPLAPGFARDPAALADALAGRIDEWKQRLDAVDTTSVADALAARFWSGRPPILAGLLEDVVALDAVDDDTPLRLRPGAVCGINAADGRLTVQLGDRRLVMPTDLEPAMCRIVGAVEVRASDLSDLLDGESRLVLVRRLVREGLLTPVAHDA